ncbi:MAG: hypothetical protein H6625_06120 [Bdellovibrionaceae bacterium]|nr:hypothetical protein [Pseudobdellovibrionaceae bacterium]
MNNLRIHFIVSLAFLILLQSCGGDDGSSGVQELKVPSPGFSVFWGSCDNTNINIEVTEKFLTKEQSVDRTCREWYGGFFSNINLQQACDSVSEGVLSENNCSEFELLGLCSVPIGIESETRYYYYKNNGTLSDAKKNCESLDIHAHWLDLSINE